MRRGGTRRRAACWTRSRRLTSHLTSHLTRSNWSFDWSNDVLDAESDRLVEGPAALAAAGRGEREVRVRPRPFARGGQRNAFHLFDDGGHLTSHLISHLTGRMTGQMTSRFFRLFDDGGDATVRHQAAKEPQAVEACAHRPAV